MLQKGVEWREERTTMEKGGKCDGDDPGLIFILNVATSHKCMQLPAMQQLWPVV